MHLNALILNVPLPFPGIAGITFGQGPSHLKHNLQGDIHANPADLQLVMCKEGKLKKMPTKVMKGKEDRELKQ